MNRERLLSRKSDGQNVMVSSNQGPDETFLVKALLAVVAGAAIVGMIFAVANGVASGFAGLLVDVGVPKESALNVYEMVRWGVVGLLFIILARVGVSAVRG